MQFNGWANISGSSCLEQWWYYYATCTRIPCVFGAWDLWLSSVWSAFFSSVWTIISSICIFFALHLLISVPSSLPIFSWFYHCHKCLCTSLPWPVGVLGLVSHGSVLHLWAGDQESGSSWMSSGPQPQRGNSVVSHIISESSLFLSLFKALITLIKINNFSSTLQSVMLLWVWKTW